MLPAVEKHAGVTLSQRTRSRAVMGSSSGGAAAFTMAWYHPEWYRRVSATPAPSSTSSGRSTRRRRAGRGITHNGVIAKSPRKPIRIWMDVGDRDLYNPNPMRDDMHDWVAANHRMATTLKAKGYHYRYVFALDSPHRDRRVREQTLPAALEFVWR